MEVLAAEGEHQEEPPTGGPGQGHHEVLGRAVGPVHVLQHEHHRPRDGGFEHGLPQVLEDAERLATSGCLRVEKGEHASRRRSVLEVLDPGDQRPHGLDHRGERDVGLEVETVPDRDCEAETDRLLLGVVHEGRLADPGVPTDQDRLRRSPRCSGQSLAQLRDLLVAAEKQRRSGYFGPPPSRRCDVVPRPAIVGVAEGARHGVRAPFGSPRPPHPPVRWPPPTGR